MKKTIIACAALALGLTFSSAPAMADLSFDECHIPNGALVQLKKGNVDTTIKILAGANSNQGANGEIVFIRTVRTPYQAFIRCSVLSGIPVDDPEVSVGDAFGFSTESDCREFRRRQSCRYILSDPGNSAPDN